MEKYCYNQGSLDDKVRKYLEKEFPELKDLSMHSDKFCEKLFREMGIKIHLGHFEKGVSQFYHAQPYIAALYLMILATEMSNNIHSPMLTDIRGLSGLGQYILWSDSIIPIDVEKDDFLMQLDIDFPDSRQLELLSFDDIIKFRNKRNDERRRFRKAIEGMRSQAQALDDHNALADYLSDQNQEIHQTIKDHKQALSEVGISNFVSGLNISCPALISVCFRQA